MANTFTMKRIFLFMSAAGIMSLTQHAMASAFQLWEQDGASVGNYHAGVAAIAEDASTAYYNPAGLVRIKNQQFVVGGDPVLTDVRFRGTVNVIESGTNVLNSAVNTQGGGFNFVPFGHYAAPITSNLVFGLSAVVPFGLNTNYGSNTDLRYIATLTSVTVYDLAPSLGLAFNDKVSVGAGLDFEHIKGEFNQFATGPLASLGVDQDTQSLNNGSGNAMGYHLGILFQPNENTRYGVSYHSKVVHHLKGRSSFIGPMANGGDGGVQTNTQLQTSTTLPPMTSVSFFHTFNPAWDFMGSVTYIQWSVFNQLVLKNVSAILDGNPSNTVTVIINEGYRNSWNYSVGANYHVSDQWMLRSGLGFDQTPSNNTDRNVQLPDSNRIAVALGAHLQATKTLTFDVGWTHLFIMNTRINNRLQAQGDETTISNGSVTGSADIYGLQMKWDIL